jgi:hypothetical protein
MPTANGWPVTVKLIEPHRIAPMPDDEHLNAENRMNYPDAAANHPPRRTTRRGAHELIATLLTRRQLRAIEHLTPLGYSAKAALRLLVTAGLQHLAEEDERLRREDAARLPRLRYGSTDGGERYDSEPPKCVMH